MSITRTIKAWALALSLVLSGPAFAATTTTTTNYSMKIVPSMPIGSAGATSVTTQPANTPYSPCSSSSAVDAVTFTLNYNAGSGSTLLDVYMLLFNPNGDGITVPKFFVVSKSTLISGGVALSARANVSNLSPSDMYLARTSNPGGAITETLLGSFIPVDGVPTGTWQVIGIIADHNTINFDDPSTWAAWDVATVVLRKPWTGNSNAVCQ